MPWPKGKKRSEQDKQSIREGIALAGTHYSPFSDCTPEQYVEWQTKAKAVRKARGNQHMITAEERAKGHATRGCIPGGVTPKSSFGLPKVERQILLEDPCVYCNDVATEIDHIQPYARGGAYDWMNRAPTCLPCNRTKNDLGLLRFLLKRQQAMA